MIVTARTVAQVAVKIELGAVTGANEGVLLMIHIEHAAHVRADARQRPEPAVLTDQETLHGTRRERPNRAVWHVRSRGYLEPPAILSDEWGRPGCRRLVPCRSVEPDAGGGTHRQGTRTRE